MPRFQEGLLEQTLNSISERALEYWVWLEVHKVMDKHKVLKLKICTRFLKWNILIDYLDRVKIDESLL